MRFSRSIFVFIVLTPAYLTIAMPLSFADTNTQPVKEAGLRSDGELVQANKTAVTTKINSKQNSEDTALKYELKRVMVTSFSTSGASESTGTSRLKTNEQRFSSGDLPSKQPNE
ncbi:MAG: hypothetical protein K6L81_14055 [Agarilytica sp.]